MEKRFFWFVLVWFSAVRVGAEAGFFFVFCGGDFAWHAEDEARFDFMCGTLEIAHLSSDSFSVEKIAEIDPNLPAANIIVCIAASIKTNQFKALMKIESNCICIAGLSF